MLNLDLGDLDILNNSLNNSLNHLNNINYEQNNNQNNYGQNEQNNNQNNIGTYISKCGEIRPIKKYKTAIPKIIMQTWKTHQVPEKWAISPQSIQAMMPDWKYVLMDDNDNRNFIQKHFPDFLPYYDAFPHNIQRADAIRYCWLYVHGGLYLDLDFEIQTDLSIAFQSSCEVFLVKSGNIGSVFTNSFMASQPGCNFWLEVIEEMKKPLPWYCIGKHFVTMCSTGPLMVSRVANRTDTIIGILPAKKVMPCSICNINCSTCDSYLRPLEGSSWIGWDTVFYNFWLCHWKKVVLFVICLLILLLITWGLYKSGAVDDKLWPPSHIFDIFK